MKYNLKSIMHTAWNLYRPGFRKRNLKGAESFFLKIQIVLQLYLFHRLPEIFYLFQKFFPLAVC